jgi:3-phenylpropionate/trans-cinnamate dioxygenase ferredoxin subunit
MYNFKVLNQAKIEFVAVGSIDELREGERIFVDIDDKPIMVIKLCGEFLAIADICSHDDGPVGEGAIEGYEIICPRHGARFDIRTGRVMALPAFVDIPAYPVRIVGDQVEVGIPSEE